MSAQEDLQSARKGLKNAEKGVEIAWKGVENAGKGLEITLKVLESVQSQSSGSFQLFCPLPLAHPSKVLPLKGVR